MNYFVVLNDIISQCSKILEQRACVGKFDLKCLNAVIIIALFYKIGGLLSILKCHNMQHFCKVQKLLS